MKDRGAQQTAPTATPLRYIENEGALFRGYAISHPEEVYSFRQGTWLPYEGSIPKPIGWGEFISPEEAEELMGPAAAGDRAGAGR